MIELGDRFRFALEANFELRVLRDFRRQDLDGHAAIEPRVPSPPHLPIPPAPSGATTSYGPRRVPVAMVMRNSEIVLGNQRAGCQPVMTRSGCEASTSFCRIARKRSPTGRNPAIASLSSKATLASLVDPSGLKSATINWR